MVIRSAEIVAFHDVTIQSQCLKIFVNYSIGFGSNASYENTTQQSTNQSQKAEQNTRELSTPRFTDNNHQHKKRASVAPRFMSSRDSKDTTSFMSEHSHRNAHKKRASAAVHYNASITGDQYRWSGTGFHFSPQPQCEKLIPLDIEFQRANMEQQLLDQGLVGVGMPPDGSCFLHCMVYEMFPLKCLSQYPSSMTVVNVGAADGEAPRRIAAATMLRKTLSEYALKNVNTLALFLMQSREELERRYLKFRSKKSEQATVAELYAAASMFNIDIHLITNDPTFRIDPVKPVPGLTPIRTQGNRTITLGYLIPSEGLAGHYICTREYSRPSISDSFVGGCYRGSITLTHPPFEIRKHDQNPYYSIG